MQEAWFHFSVNIDNLQWRLMNALSSVTENKVYKPVINILKFFICFIFKTLQNITLHSSARSKSWAKILLKFTLP